LTNVKYFFLQAVIAVVVAFIIYPEGEGTEENLVDKIIQVASSMGVVIDRVLLQ
jgi:hypothetical protein